VVDVNRAQLKYEKAGSYENKSFADTYATAYSNPEFMQLYHWGVYVTTFAWLHHLRIVRFFEQEFIPLAAATEGPRTLIDLGAGSGIWHLLALSQLSGWTAKAIDISAPTIERSEHMAAVAGLDSRIEHVLADAMTWRPPAPAGAGISCFLLEHLEQPEQLLKGLASCIEVGGDAFSHCGLTDARDDPISQF